MENMNVALGVLASKVDRGELDIGEAIERAFNLGKAKGDDEPITVRYPLSSYPPKK